ncbi:MAG: hypothetical protein N3B21_06820 [Clostridia bacterium]|nr:hypothetical protein [Clostridia bacterium]
MPLTEDTQHNLLLAITSILFILFTTGLAVPSKIEAESEVITTG